MQARLLLRSKEVLSDGAIVEMIIWSVATPVPGCRPRYKYRLYCERGGVRLVGYDNERGKGDHRHLDGVETLYDFTDVDRLVSDFLAAIRARR